MADVPQKPVTITNAPPSKAVLLDLSSGPARVGKQKPLADIVFVIDTTGSMRDKIDGLLHTCRNFVEQLAKKTIDWRIAVVAFGDLTVPGDRIEATNFSGDLAAVNPPLKSVPGFGGGSNDGESSLEALDKALSLPGYRSNSIKLFVLITDEPALKRQLSPAGVIQALKAKEVVTFVISPALDYFREMAQRTGGEWFPVGSNTDFTSILAIFDKLTQRVAAKIETIQLQAGGSVRRFLELSGPPGSD